MLKLATSCKISIFMPVYNGGKYLKESIESVVNQSFKDFELVCVDDSSTDGSYDVLTKYATLDARIKVFQKTNGGIVPKSWNFVLPLLTGDGIIYMSQDDLMSIDNLKFLYDRQQETNADCVLPDMVWFNGESVDNKIIKGVNGNRDIILTNREAVELSLNWKIHGFALWKSRVFENEYFDEDSFNSDEFMTRKLFFKSNKIVFCEGVFYYRQDNINAITKKFTWRSYSLILTQFRLYVFLKENNFNSEITNQLFLSIYNLMIKFYRFSSLRRGILKEEDYLSVRLMLFQMYQNLDNRELLHVTKSYVGVKKIKIYLVGLLFYKFFMFKWIMYLVYLFDTIFSDKKEIKE